MTRCAAHQSIITDLVYIFSPYCQKTTASDTDATPGSNYMFLLSFNYCLHTAVTEYTELIETRCKQFMKSLEPDLDLVLARAP